MLASLEDWHSLTDIHALLLFTGDIIKIEFKVLPAVGADTGDLVLLHHLPHSTQEGVEEHLKIENITFYDVWGKHFSIHWFDQIKFHSYTMKLSVKCED